MRRRGWEDRVCALLGAREGGKRGEQHSPMKELETFVTDTGQETDNVVLSPVLGGRTCGWSEGALFCRGGSHLDGTQGRWD